MGSCGSSPSAAEKAALAHSKALDKKNRQAFEDEQRKVKLLLLGAGESGKSTIFKQLRILYGTGFSKQTEEERARWESTVYNNVVQAFKTLLENVKSFEDEALAERVREAMAWPQGSAADVNADVASLVKLFWADGGVQDAWHRRADFQIQDALKYFVEQIDRIAGKKYVPNEQDILHTRIRTSGIVEESFKIDGVTFSLFDVGGQRNERKKWIHAFDSVTAVIFVAAINEYDQVLFEDNNMSRIEEAVILFDEICNSPFFKDTSMILFLNKSDLFREKLAEVPFRVDDGPHRRFADYKGPELDLGTAGAEIGSPDFEATYDGVKKYLLQLFLNRNRNKTKEIYHHVTCATDTQNIEVVFGACKDIILQRNLIGSGFAV